MSDPYLITYDITNPRRLARLHRALKRFGIPIQYSVFLAWLTAPGLQTCVTIITDILNERTDDVRIYPLPRRPWMKFLGRPPLPGGVTYTAMPDPWTGLINKPDPAEPPPIRAETSPLRSSERRTARKIQSRVQTGETRGILLLR